MNATSQAPHKSRYRLNRPYRAADGQCYRLHEPTYDEVVAAMDPKIKAERKREAKRRGWKPDTMLDAYEIAIYCGLPVIERRLPHDGLARDAQWERLTPFGCERAGVEKVLRRLLSGELQVPAGVVLVAP